ncbi:MAG: DUF4493 domain-containing protein [Bacteroidales bacterium]|nr:DUF4493 domain-containing protein [Bacteroidales bacterium]
MKLTYQAALLTAALSLGACSSEQLFDGDSSAATGRVAKPGVEVSNVETVVKQAPSRATYDVSNYIVDFYAAGQDVPYASYSYGEMPGTVELPVGSYTASIRSHNVQKAEWDKPYFVGTSEPFAIAADDITEVAPVKCVFSSLKVTVVFAESLRRVMGDDVQVTIVANDEGRLVYTPSETRAGYFEALDGSVTLAATFEGTVNGRHEVINNAFASVSKGQHRIITYEASSALPVPSEPAGGVGTEGIQIDMSYVDVDIDGNVTPGDEDVIDDGEEEPGKLPNIPGEGDGDDDKDPEPGQGGITFGGTLENGKSYTTTQLSDYSVVINAEKGIADVLVQIISTDGLTPDELEGVGLTDKFSLVTDEQYFESLSETLGFPVGDQVKNATTLSLNITEFMPLLQVLGPNTAKFVMTVTDNGGTTEVLEFTIVNP